MFVSLEIGWMEESKSRGELKFNLKNSNNNNSFDGNVLFLNFLNKRLK